jgi:hypothetical protein
MLPDASMASPSGSTTTGEDAAAPKTVQLMFPDAELCSAAVLLVVRIPR